MRIQFPSVMTLFLVLGSLETYGQPRVAGTTQIVNSTVRPWIQKSEPPGVIVVVHREGATEFFPFGEANRERQIPVTADSLFELASITKVFTTTSLAIEIEAGRMHLIDHLERYLPALKKGGDIRQVTLEQLATHTSSLPRTPGPNPRGAWDHEQLMDWLIRWRAPHSPGTKSLYSNLAVGLLGDAIAAHEQQPLQQVFEQQFLHPLGMQSTFFEPPESAQGRLVQGYGPKGNPTNRPQFNGGWPAGGRLCSSGRDMAKFLTANLGEDLGHPRITKAMQMTHQPHFKASERMTQGLCWQRVNLEGDLIIDKNGGLNSTSTYIGMIPKKKLGVVVMANRGKVTATTVGRRLLLTLAGSESKGDLRPTEEDDE